MGRRQDRVGEFLRQNGVTLGAALVLAALIAIAVRWVAHSREAPVQKKVLQITGVIVKPEPPPQAKPPPPPPPPKEPPPKEEEPQQQTRLVEVKSADIAPPDPSRPQSSEPAAGPLALAGEATGEGDAFNLAGNPGGRDVRGPGRIGEGPGGEGIGGSGGQGEGSNFGWYFGRIASEVQRAFQGNKRLQFAEARVEIRIWIDPSGVVSRIQLLRSTGDEELDQAIESVRGLRLREAMPPDLPNPAVYRFTARKLTR